jgi:hypothetical protein
MHVLPSVAAIDESRSRPIFQDYDLTKLIPVGPKVGVQDPYAFHESLISDLPVFRDENWRRGWFMTEPFVDAIRRYKLTGFDARLMYDSALHQRGFDADGEPVN